MVPGFDIGRSNSPLYQRISKTVLCAPPLLTVGWLERALTFRPMSQCTGYTTPTRPSPTNSSSTAPCQKHQTSRSTGLVMPLISATIQCIVLFCALRSMTFSQDKIIIKKKVFLIDFFRDDDSDEGCPPLCRNVFRFVHSPNELARTKSAHVGLYPDPQDPTLLYCNSCCTFAMPRSASLLSTNNTCCAAGLSR